MLLIVKNIVDEVGTCWAEYFPLQLFRIYSVLAVAPEKASLGIGVRLFTGGQHRPTYAADECKFRGLSPTTAWHILLYMPWILEAIMQRTAKIFMNNRSQAVRLPKEFQFATSEVFIRRQGNDVILSARPTDWSAYLASGPVASKEFMEDVEDLAVQEREL